MSHREQYRHRDSKLAMNQSPAPGGPGSPPCRPPAPPDPPPSPRSHPAWRPAHPLPGPCAPPPSAGLKGQGRVQAWRAGCCDEQAGWEVSRVGAGHGRSVHRRMAHRPQRSPVQHPPPASPMRFSSARWAAWHPSSSEACRRPTASASPASEVAPISASLASTCADTAVGEERGGRQCTTG